MRNSRDFQIVLPGVGVDPSGLNPEAQESLGYAYLIDSLRMNLARRGGLQFQWAGTIQAVVVQRGRIEINTGQTGLWILGLTFDQQFSMNMDAFGGTSVTTVAVPDPDQLWTQDRAGQFLVSIAVTAAQDTPVSNLGVTFAAGTGAAGAGGGPLYPAGVLPHVDRQEPLWLPPGGTLRVVASTTNVAVNFSVRGQVPFTFPKPQGTLPWVGGGTWD